ncbi:PREDICTED: uncharacterized protein LOC105113097 [Populus euphratica]|uniref:Uncharacterized protein LOC105113097 n=1 Tax=Populus euphratica TaxID=75702 RepID=A0AAJ6X6R9_POPEU|nr:PREDICTED: uncharacterized protein LOC105113097 [Populus euphratica]
MELEAHQTVFHYDKDNIQHQDLDKQLCQKLFNLIKSTERLFFAQKLKCNFFRECDEGSSFFHTLISRQHRKNSISTIQLNDGSLTASIDEVRDAFVCYFRDLPGSHKDTLPLDVEVSRSGPCLDPASYASLLAPVTNDIIKQALLSIDDDKAPGLDGYTFSSKNPGTLLVDTSVWQFVISKILSARFAIAPTNIISPLQNAFLGRRLMADNIHLLQELLRLYEPPVFWFPKPFRAFNYAVCVLYGILFQDAQDGLYKL